MKNYQFIILIVLILLWIWSNHYLISKVPEKVTANMLKIEYDKVWWMENYIKINQIQKKQIIAWLKAYEAQNGSIPVQSNSKQNTESNFNKISLAQVKQIEKVNTQILWNPDAQISWVEYSDMDCPYCKRLHNSWAVEKILKNYVWKVNFIFKQFPVHSPMKAAANICVWKLWWSKKYYTFIDELFNSNLSSSEDVAKLAWSLWLDSDKILSCMNSKDTKNLVLLQTKEAEAFWINWTPGNILINNKTWNWDKLPWAYPYEAFKNKIDNLLK